MRESARMRGKATKRRGRRGRLGQQPLTRKNGRQEVVAVVVAAAVVAVVVAAAVVVVVAVVVVDVAVVAVAVVAVVAVVDDAEHTAGVPEDAAWGPLLSQFYIFHLAHPLSAPLLPHFFFPLPSDQFEGMCGHLEHAMKIKIAD